jgi:hypothetical protein
MRQLSKNQIKKGAEEVSDAVIRVFGKNGSLFVKRLIIISFLFLFNINVTTTPGMGDTQAIPPTLPTLSKEEIYVRSVKEKMMTSLINEVDKFLLKVAPETELTPSFLVEKCLEYDMDMVFVLSQGLIESHFGTKGLATKTNSVWNVGAYDDQRPKNWYESQDESIEPYLKLVTEKYLIEVTSKGDTIYKDLQHLVLYSYTNYDGKRFASARGYENAMRKLMVKIDMETNISFYQNILSMPPEQMIAYFNPDISEASIDNFLAMN